MEVVVDWWWPEETDFDLCRCLYAYLHPRTDELLYLGKADRQSVRQRMRGRHKDSVYEYLEREWKLEHLRPIIGELMLDESQRFSSALLADVESLLIHRLTPACNVSCIDSRISRPGLTIECRGDWPHRRRTFRDA